MSSQIDFSEIEIYKGSTLDQLFKQIHDNSNKKSSQLDTLIHKLSNFVQGQDDAALLVPLIADYLEVAVKNDEQLIKLAGIVQRFMKATTSEDNASGTLTEEEKKELRDSVRKQLKEDSNGKILKIGNS